MATNSPILLPPNPHSSPSLLIDPHSINGGQQVIPSAGMAGTIGSTGVLLPVVALHAKWLPMELSAHS